MDLILDKKELIEKITKEVMARISASSGSDSSEVKVVCVAEDGECINCQLCVANNPNSVKKILDEGASRVSSTIGVVNVPADLARYIDHTLLRPDATRSEIEQLCDEAIKYGFYSVCVNPYWVETCARILRGKAVKVCSVVGFPLGATDSRTKAFETRNAIENGASEIDMVINIGALKSGDLRAVEEDIRAVRRSTRSTTILKVIIETCLLTEDEKIIACELAKKAEADFVKTSTGFSKGGATTADIALMRRVVGSKMGIKAAGGIRSYEDAKKMIETGATRIGASASVKIVSGEKS